MTTKMSERLKAMPGVLVFGYLFFLALQLLSSGMKTSFKKPLGDFLAVHAEDFTELVSFVFGILGTAVIQSSSSVTSMAVVLTQDGVLPIVIAAGVVHGANLGTSVTSSMVAFATEVRPLTGNPIKDLRIMLFEPRGPGFSRAVGAAVVHDVFNIVLVTTILLTLELPFGLILSTSDWGAGVMANIATQSDWILDVLKVLSPGTYTKPVTHALLEVGVPGWLLALTGLPLLLFALRGFASRMRALVMVGVDLQDLSQVGDTLLGKNPLDTFARGLVLTILVQSSSATTSMVVPLAAMGFFGVRRVFPFILGANIGTTTTALLAASGSLGLPGFHAGMTIALCHLLLNTLAVAIAAVVPGVSNRIMAAAEVFADRAAQRPVLLLAYLFCLVIVTPLAVYALPNVVAALLLAAAVIGVLLSPRWATKRQPGEAP